MKKTLPIKRYAKADATPVKSVNRRDFFNTAWKGLGILAVVEVLGITTAFMFSGKPKNTNTPRQLLEAGSVDAFTPGTVSAFMGGRFYLARQQDGGFIALSLRCTHLGCSIAWEEEQNRFVCPCHSSAFDITGEVLNPPAARALNYYPVIIENGIVKVDIGTIVERHTFRKDQLQYA